MELEVRYLNEIIQQFEVKFQDGDKEKLQLHFVRGRYFP